MKKLVVILGLCLFCCGQVQAEEISANQTIVSEDNKAVISVQKQPTDIKSAQTQDVKRNWFCIVIQVNGKAQDNPDTVR